MYRRLRNLSLTAAVLLAAAPGAASAATVETNPNYVTFKGDAGENNDLLITQSGGSVTFNDPGKTINSAGAGADCGAPVGGQITCTLGSRTLKIDLGDADDEVESLAAVESKIQGGPGVDTITGGPADDKIDGDGENDTLYGGDGNDKVDGLAGVDQIHGGAGNDTLDGGSENDTLRGDGDSDFLTGGAGLDQLDGGAGGDRLAGNGDRDTYTGGPGRDSVDWSDEVTPVVADFDANSDDGPAGANELLPADVEEAVGGSAADKLSAGPSGNTLRGGGGADALAGGLGADALDGGADADVLTGGGGKDSFAAGAGADRIFARDGANEVIVCGTEADHAEVDPLDIPDADCESVDDGQTLDDGDDGDGNGDAGTPPPPQLGKSVTVAPARGVVTVRQPGGRTVTLQAGDDIPVGSIVDTTRGAVALTSAADASGKTQTAQFSHGVFQVRQPRGKRPVTELVLKGKLDCGGAAAGRRGKLTAARGPHGRKRKRRLWGSGHGRFRTRGRRSSATVRGTIWLTEDRCSGTYTKVKRGVVAVKDFRTGKTKLVRAGKSYFAKTKRPAAKRKRR